MSQQIHQSQVIEGQVRFRARAKRDAELRAEFACARNEIGAQVRVECEHNGHYRVRHQFPSRSI